LSIDAVGYAFAVASADPSVGQALLREQREGNDRFIMSNFDDSFSVSRVMTACTGIAGTTEWLAAMTTTGIMAEPPMTSFWGLRLC